ncbi:MAG: Zn-binding domain-containing protein [Myxococcales bacterium]
MSLRCLRTAEGVTFKQRAQVCDACGYLHPLGATAGPDLCERCGAELPAPLANLFRMQNVVTRRRDRITSDEEERQRQGYEIVTAVRFAERRETPSARESILRDETGAPLAQLVYGDAATIWRLNHGWRRRARKEERGFMLDVERGIWEKKPDDEGPDELMSARIERVIPYVEDTRNCLVLTPAAADSPEELTTLAYALKSAIERHFQLEERELSAELLPVPHEARAILIYEASEGGAGVLKRLVDDQAELRTVAAEALRLSHFDPETLADRGSADGAPEPCEAACYDCLLSYFNQRDHARIDRQLVPKVLGPWRTARLETAPRPTSRREHFERLLRFTESELERKWLRLVDGRGHRLPSEAQFLLAELGTRADFAYRDAHLLVFVDGPPHDTAEAQAHDTDLTEQLEDAGWTVLRFHHAAEWTAILDRFQSIFGRPRSVPPLDPR